MNHEPAHIEIDVKMLAKGMKALNGLITDAETSPAILIKDKDRWILAELRNMLWDLQHGVSLQGSVVVTKEKKRGI